MYQEVRKLLKSTLEFDQVRIEYIIDSKYLDDPTIKIYLDKHRVGFTSLLN